MTRPVARSTTARSSARPAPVPPPAQRLPAPRRGVLLLRIMVAMCVLHTMVAPSIRTVVPSAMERVQTQLRTATAAVPTEAITTLLERVPIVLGGHVLRASALLTPITGAVSAVALIVIGAELLLAVCWHVLFSAVVTRSGGAYVRVRVPRPQTTREGAVGVGVLQLLSESLAPSHGSRRWGVRLPAPVSVIISGMPDQPCSLGIYVRGPSAQRSHVLKTFHKLVQGIAPGALVDEQPDPLASVLVGNRTAVMHELTLRCGPEYPLRLMEAFETDPLGTLAAALSPRPGTVLTQCSITLTPAPGWTLSAGWRARALKQLLLLGAKQEYQLSGDTRVIEAKLRGVAYFATIRLLAVAASPETVAHAVAEVREASAIMGQYAQRSGNRHQALRIHRRRTIHVRQRVQQAAHDPGDAAPPSSSGSQWETLRGRVVRYGLLIAGCVAGGVLGSAAHVTVLARSAAAVAAHWPPLLGPVPEPAPLWPIAAAAFIVASGLGGMLAVFALTPQWRRHRAHTALVRLLCRVPRVPIPPRLLQPWGLWRGPDLLTAEELSGMWHLPASTLMSLVELLPYRVLPAPPHAFATDQAARIVIGDAWRRDGSMVPVGPDLHSLRGGLHFTGGMGKGKTQLMCNLATQFVPHGFIALDGKGDDEGNLTMSIRTRLPVADEARLVLIDLADSNWPMGINLFGRTHGSSVSANDQALGQLMTTLARLDPESWGKSHGMATYARNGMLLVLEGERHPTMAHLKQALIDDAYRATLLGRCANRDVRLYWTVTYPQETESQKGSRIALLRRLDSVLTTALTRYLVTQTSCDVDFLECVEQRRIVLFALPHRALGELSAMVATMMLQVFIRDVFRRSGSAMTRSDYALLIDELQIFVNTAAEADVDVLLTQLRAFGILGVYTHQTLAQLGTVRDTMLINASNRIVLQVDEPDASVYADRYKAYGITAADISLQHCREHQYANLLCDGMPTGPLSIRPRPWPPEVPVLVERQQGRDWQDALPAGRRSATTMRIDTLLKRLAWPGRTAERGPDVMAFVDGCVAMADDDWAALKGRWLDIRQAERAALLADPGQVPDRLLRQQWLSRLGFAVPQLAADVDYARIRRDIEGPVFAAGGRAASPAPQRPAAKGGGGSVAPGAAQPGVSGGVTSPPPSWRQLRQPADVAAVASQEAALRRPGGIEVSAD